MTPDLEERLKTAEWMLEHSGFRRCDSPACNCNSWHQVGGFRARFDEIKEVVEDAGYSTNGRTLLDAVKAMATAPRQAEGWRTDVENLPKDGTEVIFPLELVGRAFWCADQRRWVLTYPLHMEYVSRPTKFRLPQPAVGESPDQEEETK